MSDRVRLSAGRIRLADDGRLRACPGLIDSSTAFMRWLDAGTLHWLIRNDGVLGLTVIGPAGIFRSWPVLPA